MTTKQEEFEIFQSEFESVAKEILVVTSDSNGGSGRIGQRELWTSSMDFLAYVDLASGELINGDGRLNWLISDEDRKAHGYLYPYYFKQGEIYRLKVCELKDKTIPPHCPPLFENRFMIVEVLEEGVYNDPLNDILTEYRRPVTITDKELGEFDLDKNLHIFRGAIQWLGMQVSVMLEVDSTNKESCTKAMDNLRTMVKDSAQKDREFCAFAAAELTTLANDWREDEDDSQEITEDNFARRITLSSLVISVDGNYIAYYNDDDMFYGHVVAVEGSIKNGIKSASMEG